LNPYEGPNRPKTVSEWLQGGSLLKPEIFHHRWRTDKDPTLHLASFDFIVKKPLPHSSDANYSSKVILEDDIIAQFDEQMQLVASLGDTESKMRALKNLQPVMNQFRSVVSRFVMDDKLLKTSQGRRAGRSNASLIHVKSGGGVRKLKYPATGSQTSLLARAKNHNPTDSAASRKPHGNNNHIPDDQKWLCPLCNVKITNKPDLISQHKGSKKHQGILQKMRHCDTCNVFFPNTPDEVDKHNKSNEHLRVTRFNAEPDTRDGQILAKRTRDQNAGAVVQNHKFFS
jgi:hypothetical protein